MNLVCKGASSFGADVKEAVDLAIGSSRDGRVDVTA